MPEIVFVHGTGVRRVAYDKSLYLVRAQSKKYLNDAAVHQCLWGEPQGARLRLGGASIPSYDDQHKPGDSAEEAAQIELVTWRMLREDPLFELRLLEGVPAPKRELAPLEVAPGQSSWNLLAKLQPPPTVLQILRDRGFEEFWKSGYDQLLAHTELKNLLVSANRDPREVSRSLARALVACINAAALDAASFELAADTREDIVQLLIPLLGKQALGVFDWVTKPLFGLAKRYGTYKARRERRVISDSSAPGAGDILLYQARGGAIRRFIRDRIDECKSQVVVFAHSLGGIAAVDLLASYNFQGKVIGLVTIGSQAPLLYEINALKSLPFGKRLPDRFPKKWLNLYDPNDFLSYSAEMVFGKTAVTDVMLKSKLPFPDSHSAYLDQTKTWTAIQGFFPW